MKDWSFQLEGLLSGRWPVFGALAKVPVSFGWPANFWTTIRFFGALWVILSFKINPLLGALCFVLCLYTDALDGLIARCQAIEYSRRPKLWLDFFWWLYVFDVIGKKTYDNIGKWFDPLADKVFIIACLYYFGLYVKDLINPTFFCLMVVVEFSGRGVIIPVVRKIIMRKPLYIKANKLGKAKFIVEALLGVIVMLCYLVDFPWLINGVVVLMLTAIVLSVGSISGHLWPEFFVKIKLLTPD